MAAAVVVAGGAGAWFGSHQPSASLAAAAHGSLVEAKAAAAPVRHTARPERLLSATSLLSHRFSPALLASSAILVDADDGRVLWELKAHERRPVASTTKIMTALLALRKLGPTDIVTVDPSVPRVPLVREGLRAGERVQARKLFYSMLLYSGNDDALALAIAAAGDKWTFVHRMNAEAQLLGLHDTHFISPSGVVDRGNYSSAWDLAALTRVALRNPRFAQIVRTKVEHVSWSAPTYAKVYVNNNRMLTEYPGANGVKTGYTHKSGPCLVVSATRGEHTLLAVVLNSPNMYRDATRLLNVGFESLS